MLKPWAGLSRNSSRSDGNYYVLTAPSTAVQVYDAAGKRLGRSRDTAAKARTGLRRIVRRGSRRHLAVSDRGENAVKVYSRTARLPRRSRFRTGSVALLTGGEVAIAARTHLGS